MLVFLIAGMSWLVVASTGCFDVVAFVATRTTTTDRTMALRLQYPLSIRPHNKNYNIGRIPIHSPSSSLFESTVDASSESTVVLEGKLRVLQDVVKQLDVRLRKTKTTSETLRKEHQEDLYLLQTDLAASELSLSQERSKLAIAEQVLKEVTARHEADLAAAAEEGRRATEKSLADRTKEHEAALDQLRKDKDKQVQEVREELATEYTALSEELSVQWNDADKEKDKIGTEKDRLVEELRSKLENQETQLALLLTEREESNNNDNDKGSQALLDAANVNSEDRLADLRADLEAKHRTEIEEKQATIDALQMDNKSANTDAEERLDKLREDLAATHRIEIEEKQAAIDALEMINEAANAAAEGRLVGLRVDLEEQHDTEIKDIRADIKVIEADKQKLEADLFEKNSSFDEQIAIAKASVRAGETREAALRKKVDQLQKNARWYWLLARMASLAADAIDADHRRFEDEHRALLQKHASLEDELDRLRNDDLTI